jgi:flagellar hook assembly protein FlgD
MTRPALILVLALIAATLAALVVDQHLKQAPAVVRRVRVARSFSPNGDRSRDRALIRFVVTRRDVAAVTVLDADGHVVRHLATHRAVRPNRKLRFYWNGRTDAGRLAPPGIYRVRVTLRRRHRTVDLLRQIRLSARPARA